MLIYVFGGVIVIPVIFGIVDTMIKIKTKKLLDKSA